MMKLKSFALLSLALATSFIFNAGAQDAVTRARTPFQIPEIPGYLPLKFDFHLHTVFSDGLVWPTVRVEEAWRDGLDGIAITDHIEYQPFKADVTTNHNRSFEIARRAGDDLDIIVLKGSEITRDMPPGHLNGIFLKDSDALAVPNWRDALEAAKQQDAFVFWNHPGWTHQSPDGTSKWYPEHTELLEKGILKGIEIVNGRDYYPDAHQLAIDHKLTLFANSDLHNPAYLDYTPGGEFRPVTIVFAKARTAESVKEALLARRTAVYSRGRLMGAEELLRPVFQRSIKVLNPKVRFQGTARKMVQIHNTSAISYQLELSGSSDDVNAPKQITLAAGKTVLLTISAKPGKQLAKTKLNLEYKVTNLICAPDQPLMVKIELEAI
jgi:3',5'-nucleoside bisphosphate phosphatase